MSTGSATTGAGTAEAATVEAATRVHPADVDAVRTLLRDEGVGTVPSRPGPFDYLGDLTLALAQWMAERVESALGMLRLPSTAIVTLVLQILLLILLAVAVGYLVRMLFGRRAVSSAGMAPADEPASVGAEDVDAATARRRHREALEARLRAGDATGALEALWWWLAWGLVPTGVDAAWTSRELLDRGGRPDLRPEVRSLDRLLYGSAAPTPDEVEILFRRLGEVVP